MRDTDIQAAALREAADDIERITNGPTARMTVEYLRQRARHIAAEGKFAALETVRSFEIVA